MPGDELHETNAAAPGARTGPRHAAPRKPLLTRLHVPAGKAIAIAAMPSAVLMGMGLTPQLAMAKPQPPESPFRNGPCVSAPDKAEQDGKDKAEKEKAEKEKAEKDKAAKEKAAKDKAAEDGKSARPGKDQTAGGSKGGAGTDTTPPPSPDASSRTPSPSPDTSGKTPAPTPSPSASSTPTEQNPWYDPLGVGKKLHDVFHPGQEKPAGPGATPTPSPSGDSGTGHPAGKPSAKPTDPLKDAVGKAGEAAGDATGKAGKAAKDAAKDAKDKADDASPSASPSPSGSADPGAPDADGKKPFPCVEEKKVAGQDERPPATVPNQPWYLESSGLTLRGLDYEGVVNLTMPNGRTKQALKFTADSIDIGDLHQIVDGPAGKKYHVQAAAGSTSTIRGGKVTMYTERLQGNLFGLIPIVFDPEHPPPINVPFAYFTKVKITQAGQFGGTLTIPGLHQSITG
ncbi:hypothetical protein CP973_32595 [Streptomyces albofaciens JCM 4342]|uniref:hypothetical protein n=1 Tax=Streptomyces albofaciens TaxID=66866 RepID=UPI00123BC3A4|nr:hypothetical protein [Streptomyces albofaciens]KAA6213915.1 hypothetical protein CP973_32595 [Streptomyces albofaciens JCM 4342]